MRVLSGRGRGATVVEVLVAAAISVVVLTALVVVWRTGMRAGRLAQSSLALTAAALLEVYLSEDIAQMGIDPTACPATDIMRVREDALAFHRVVFRDADRFHLRPVVYRLLPSPGGNRFLERTEGRAPALVGRSTVAQAVFQDLTFRRADHPTGILLSATGTLLDADERPGPYRRGFPFSLVLRVPIPGDLCNPRLALAMRVEVEGPLPALP